MFDPELFGQAMGEAIKSAVAPLQAKIADLEKQLAQRPDVADLVSAEVSKAVAAIPAAKDGKDCDMAAVKALVDEAVKSIPTPKDGKSVTLDDVQPVIKEVTMRLELDAANVRKTVDDALAAVDERMKEIRQPEDGRSVTFDEVRPMLDEAIKQLRQDADEAIAEPLKMAEVARDQLFKALGELRQPEDGKSVTVDDVAPIIKTEVEKAVALIPVPKDGAGVAGAVIDRDGNLNLTLTNGEVKNLGRVEGKDGQNGKDGLGFDDLQVEYDGERTVTLKLVRDGIVKEANIKLPVVLDRGVFKEGVTYDAADGVTWGGSYWIAKKATGTRPGEGNGDWRLSVKKGRDGKDGRDGIDFNAPVSLKGGEK